jgi:hypothetical protein
MILEIQGDQRIAVHLMITTQKVTSNVQTVPRQSPDIYRHAELFSKTVFSTARSAFPLYPVMAIFKSSITFGLFECTELFITYQVHSDLFDYPVYRSHRQSLGSILG